jgi:hypothetical protein
MDINTKRKVVDNMLTDLGHEGLNGGFYEFSEFVEVLLGEIIEIANDEQLDLIMDRVENTSMLGIDRNNYI